MFFFHLLNFQGKKTTFQAAGFAGSFRISPFESFYPKGLGPVVFYPKPLRVEVVNMFFFAYFFWFFHDQKEGGKLSKKDEHVFYFW